MNKGFSKLKMDLSFYALQMNVIGVLYILYRDYDIFVFYRLYVPVEIL